MLLLWCKPRKQMRQKFIEAGKVRAERVLEEERRATQIKQPETTSEDIPDQRSKVGSK
jgi:hypothetical protein